MTKKNAVATTSPDTDVALPFDYGDHAGVGMDLSMDDFRIPFIGLVQKDSKCLDKDEENYVPGGDAGMLLNSATKEYIPARIDDGNTGPGLLLVPAMIATTYVEYLPDRGGFVAEHQLGSDVIAKSVDGKTEAGNDLVKTKSIFGIVVDEKLAPVGWIRVPFTASKLGPWSDYFTQIQTAKAVKSAPVYAHLIRLGTKFSKNAKGKFFNYSMFPARDTDGNLTLDPLKGAVIPSMLNPSSDAFKTAVQLRDAIDQGRAKTDMDEDATGGGRDNDSDEHF